MAHAEPGLACAAVWLCQLHAERLPCSAASSRPCTGSCGAVGHGIRYTHHGGQIDISLFTWADNVWLQVADNGPGIAEDALERVFDPFFRVEQHVDGTGLGLAIVQRLALRWQGKIVLRNRSEGGLVASLQLPAALPHLR